MTPGLTSGPAGVATPVADLAARARRRRRESARPRLAAAVAGVLLAALLAGVVWTVYGTGALGVRTVRVTGTDGLTAAEVEAAAAIPAGRPLARLDPDAIGARVLGSVARVADVDVARRWPSTVVIHVRERVPVAAVVDGRGFRLVDAQGVAVDRVAARAVPPGLVAVTLPRAAAAPLRTGGVRDALHVVAALPPSVRADLRRIDVAGPADLRLALRGDRTVRWGGGDATERKAQVLAALLRRPGTVYDVSVPTVVTVR